MKNTLPPSIKYISGLTLIEVLITIIILAVGLLGMAAMQMSGIRSVNGAGYRTQASILATDIVERVRANPTAVDDNLFADIDSDDIDCGVTPNPYCSQNFDGTSTVAAQSCTVDELQAFDVNTWYCGEINSGTRNGGVDTNLPDASATIACVDSDGGADADACTNGSNHIINIFWTEPNPQRNGPATIQQRLSITFQP